MSISTPLTERLGITHPVMLAPMAMVSGGRLAAAVTAAGGLGMIGGGYGDGDWLRNELAAAGDSRVGCGFITWSLARQPELLDTVLAAGPSAIMLAFGDAAPFIELIRSTGAALVLQVCSIAELRSALDAEPDVIVVQGGEAGGHGTGERSTFTLVPEARDVIDRAGAGCSLAAAGGVADGRGLAAALALGADGALVGSRFVMAEEALTARGAQRRVEGLDGDATARTSVLDLVRGKDWPAGFDGRVMRNRFVDRWQGDEAALADALEQQTAAYADAVGREDFDTAGLFVGQAVGLMPTVRPAAEIVESMVADAERILGR